MRMLQHALRLASTTVAVRSQQRPKHARRSDKIDVVSGESLIKITWDRPVPTVPLKKNYALSASRETCILSWPLDPAVFFVNTVCDRLGQGQLESAVSCREWEIICLLPAVFNGTVLHLHSRTCFWQDYCHCSLEIESSLLSGSFYQTPARLRCVFFSSVLIFVGEEKEEVWFDNSGHCSRSNIGLARWAYSQPTAPVRTVCDSLLFESTLATRQ